MARPRRINLLGGPAGRDHVTQLAAASHSMSFSLARENIKRKYLELAYDMGKKDPFHFPFVIYLLSLVIEEKPLGQRTMKLWK